MGIPDELKLRQHVHLGDFTTWKVGGDAEYFKQSKRSATKAIWS